MTRDNGPRLEDRKVRLSFGLRREGPTVTGRSPEAGASSHGVGPAPAWLQSTVLAFDRHCLF